MRLLTKKITLLFFLLFMYGVQADAQIFVNNCDHCPTFALQINSTYNGECGYAFDYSGLIGCDVIGEDWKFQSIQIPNSTPPGTATGQYVYFEFPNPGTYLVTLTLTLTDGNKTCRKVVTTTVSIAPNDCNQDLICTGGGWRLSDYDLILTHLGGCHVFAAFNYSPNPNSGWYRTATSFNWGDGSPTFHGNVAGASHIFPRNGTYTICGTITISNGVDICQKRVCKKITLTNCGPMKMAPDLPPAEFSISPNPIQAGSQLTLWGDLDPSVREITMMDNQGRIVERWNTTDDAATKQELRIPSGISPGIYFLRSNSAAMPVQKLIVQ